MLGFFKIEIWKKQKKVLCKVSIFYKSRKDNNDDIQ